jgi:hypothetical protein
LPGPKKKDLKSSGWFVDRCVDRPVDRRRPVDRPDRASGSAAGVAGRSSGRRLAADRPVGFADWTLIGSLFLMHTLVVVIDTARAARSLAEGSNKAKHIFYARAHLCTEMQRVLTSLTKQPNFGTGTHISLRSGSEFLYILSLRNQTTTEGLMQRSGSNLSFIP